MRGDENKKRWGEGPGQEKEEEEEVAGGGSVRPLPGRISR